MQVCSLEQPGTPEGTQHSQVAPGNPVDSGLDPMNLPGMQISLDVVSTRVVSCHHLSQEVKACQSGPCGW